MKSQFNYFLLALVLLITASCNKNEEHDNPTLSFKQTDGYTYQDITVKMGETIKIGLEASTQSDVNLSAFSYTINVDGLELKVDSGINVNNFTWERTIEKGAGELESWIFEIADKDGRSSSLTLVITKDASSTYAPISKINNVVLGAQDNVNGSFFSFGDSSVFTLGNAFNNQDKIHLVYYFDEVGSDMNTLASPGASFDEDVFAGQYSIAGWGTKLTTRYAAKSIDEAEFTIATNDSLILANTFEFASGKRKAKELEVGDTYAFVTEDNYKGLFIVKALDSQSAGTIAIDIMLAH
jgi:hypothetical protein